MKRRNVHLKLTRHNGRAGAHGTYNPKHNDRSFNLANSEHIDPERAKGNIYWDCFHGFRSALDPQDPDDLAATFSDVERQFYETHYTAFIESQNERNAKIRHTERNRSIPDLLSNRKTCPEETIYQLGTLDEHASAEDLLSVVTEFIEKFKAKYGDHVHVLDWALHLDESTPHIHERHVFDCENKYGEVAPQQEKALEALGFELPDPDKPLSRRNNRKITFDAACRKMLFEIAKRHGLDLEEEAEYGNRKYLEKQDFILAKQKEQLAAQQSKLDELTLKVSDMETLLENVSAAAYDKAVDSYTEYDLLDGQQRITTVFLILACMRDMLTDYPQYQNSLAGFVYQAEDAILQQPERMRIIFNIRSDVRDFVNEHIKPLHGTCDSALLKDRMQAKDVNISIRNMANAMRVAHEFLEENKSEIIGYLSYFLNKVLMIYVATEELQDAFQLFTVLNNRGVKLSSSDILKAENLKELSAADRTSWATRWEEMETYFGDRKSVV